MEEKERLTEKKLCMQWFTSENDWFLSDFGFSWCACMHTSFDKHFGCVGVAIKF